MMSPAESEVFHPVKLELCPFVLDEIFGLVPVGTNVSATVGGKFA